MSDKQATYLGDGVYAQGHGSCEVRIYTSDGITETNSIYLEPQSIDRLNNFVKNLWKKPLDVIAHHELKKEWEK